MKIKLKYLIKALKSAILVSIKENVIRNKLRLESFEIFESTRFYSKLLFSYYKFCQMKIFRLRIFLAKTKKSPPGALDPLRAIPPQCWCARERTSTGSQSCGPGPWGLPPPRACGAGPPLPVPVSPNRPPSSFLFGFLNIHWVSMFFRHFEQFQW